MWGGKGGALVIEGRLANGYSLTYATNTDYNTYAKAIAASKMKIKIRINLNTLEMETSRIYTKNNKEVTEPEMWVRSAGGVRRGNGFNDEWDYQTAGSAALIIDSVYFE